MVEPIRARTEPATQARAIAECDAVTLKRAVVHREVTFPIGGRYNVVHWQLK